MHLWRVDRIQVDEADVIMVEETAFAEQMRPALDEVKG